MLLNTFYNKEPFFLGLTDVKRLTFTCVSLSCYRLQAIFSQMDVDKLRKQDTNAILKPFSHPQKKIISDKIRRIHDSAKYIYVLVNPKKGRVGGQTCSLLCCELVQFAKPGN